MTRIMEELKTHIHDRLCNEVNDTMIAIKLADPSLVVGKTEEEKDKILKASANHPPPTTEEMIDLLTRIRDEMNSCTIPIRVR